MKKVVSTAPEAVSTGTFRPSIQRNGRAMPLQGVQPQIMQPVQTVMPGPVVTGPDGAQTQQLAQMGIPVLPGMAAPQGGQTISVTMNAPSPHLPFWQWVGRGIVGGIGHGAAFPFLIIRDISQQIVKFLFKALMVVMIPTLLLVGCQLRQKMEHAASVEQGAQTIVEQGRHAARGLRSGVDSDIDRKDAKKEDGRRAAEAAR